jgi:hypothetical protein
MEAELVPRRDDSAVWPVVRRERVKFRIIKVGLALVVATAVGVVAVRLLGEDEDESERQGGTSPVSQGPIRFLFDDSYAPRARVDVKIENVGTRGYRYVDTQYAACFLRYFDSSGREFKIPPGTHCDIISPATIEPGEVRTLFTWRLNECVKDRWGCVKSRPLPPGTYTVRGSFRPMGGGMRARPEATVRIVAP